MAGTSSSGASRGTVSPRDRQKRGSLEQKSFAIAIEILVQKLTDCSRQFMGGLAGMQVEKRAAFR
jgi:hypothetical protein